MVLFKLNVVQFGLEMFHKAVTFKQGQMALRRVVRAAHLLEGTLESFLVLLPGQELVLGSGGGCMYPRKVSHTKDVCSSPVIRHRLERQCPATTRRVGDAYMYSSMAALVLFSSA